MALTTSGTLDHLSIITSFCVFISSTKSIISDSFLKKAPNLKYSIRSVATLLTILATTTQAQYVLKDESEVAALDMFQECDVCPEMIVLPLGDFLMGGPIGDSINGLVMLDGKLTMVEVGHPAIGSDERPLHHVEIDIPIAMGSNEIKHDQRIACVDDGGLGRHVLRDTCGLEQRKIYAT